MSLCIAQQVGIKNDGHNSKNKQPATHAIIFIYFPNFSSYPNREHTDGSTKIFSLKRVKMWSIENQARSLKNMQQLWSFMSPT
jgi:hypothetical protein